MKLAEANFRREAGKLLLAGGGFHCRGGSRGVGD